MVSFLLDFLKKSQGHVAPILKIPGSFMMEAVVGYRRGHPFFEPTIVVLAEVYYSTRWNSAISSWLSVLPGIVADSDRRWAIKVDTLGSFAP